MSETGSSYAHPYQITAHRFKTRTYKTEAAMRKAAQEVANKIGREVKLWAYNRHNQFEYWGGVLPIRPANLVHVRVTGNRTQTHIAVAELPDSVTSVGDIAAVLFPLTGGNLDTQVGIEITRADTRPELVGFKFTWEG